MTAAEIVPNCIAFHGNRKLAEGDRATLAAALKPLFDRGEPGLLAFDVETGERVEFDLRGTLDAVAARLSPTQPVAATEPAAPRGPGRPKLGVVAREVTLLPRHWEWLARQRGGASVTLRRLIDQARHASADQDRVRAAQEAAYRFATVMAGDQPDYEEATRALFAGDADKFQRCTAAWPVDVRDHTRRLAQRAFSPPAG